MIETKKSKKTVDVVTDVICDSCGKSCKEYPIKDKSIFMFEFMKLRVAWGYGSDKDGERWTADICEKCVDEKFKFVKFKKEDYDVLSGEARKVRTYDKPAKLNS